MEEKEVVQQSKPKSKKKVWIIAIIVLVVLAAAAIGAYFVMDHINNEPIVYMDENGREVKGLSRNQMAEAYERGVSYFEQGDYENAIVELNKVTDASSKYEDAQRVREEAMAAYAKELIEQSAVQLESGNYEAALAIVEEGKALIGDDAQIYDQVQNILNTLKADMIAQMTQAEQQGDYTQALQCIQIAKSFLPDDTEVQANYDRVYAMSVALAALTEAEEHMEDEDVEKAFKVLDEALKEVQSDQAAASKITDVYETYKREYLKDVKDLAKKAKKSLKFDEALEALSTAADVFSDDEDVQELYKEITDLNTAHTTIAAAEELADAAAYEELFPILDAALAKVDVDSDAEELLDECYETHKAAYMTLINEQIGDPKTISQYEEAIALLSVAVELWPDDEELADRLEELKDSLPVAVNTMNIVDMKEYRTYKDWQIIDSDDLDDCVRLRVSATDNFATNYNDASLIICGGHSEYYGGTYITYDCAQYSKLSGVAALWEESKSHAQNAIFFITGYKDDGTEVMLLQKNFPSGTRPQLIDLDLTEYSLVRIGIKAVDEKGKVAQVWPVPIGVILSDLAMSK